jgi:hypothetical protein
VPILYKFGKDIKTGEPVFIKDASNGLSCGCVCFECGKEFEAMQGGKKDWYFKHYNNDTNCNGGQETALHKLAKKIIADNNEMPWSSSEIVSYINAVQENRFHEIIPDVTATSNKDSNKENIFFEILVTHPVGEEKEKFYTEGKHKSIEIDLRNYSFTTPEKLENDVLRNIDNKRVIFPKEEEKATTKPDLFDYIIYGILVVGGIFVIRFILRRVPISIFNLSRKRKHL